jgi:hypothetical protein
MNIDNLTIGEAKALSSMFASQNQPVGGSMIGSKVLVRAYRAGVHFGTLKSISGEVVTLINTRRLWSWEVADKKGISLSDLAAHGVSSKSKICASVAEIIVIDACEVMTTTLIAQASIEAANDYRP